MQVGHELHPRKPADSLSAARSRCSKVCSSVAVLLCQITFIHSCVVEGRAPPLTPPTAPPAAVEVRCENTLRSSGGGQTLAQCRRLTRRVHEMLWNTMAADGPPGKAVETTGLIGHERCHARQRRRCAQLSICAYTPALRTRSIVQPSGLALNAGRLDHGYCNDCNAHAKLQLEAPPSSCQPIVR